MFMRRLLFVSMSALSLMVCISVVAMWARSQTAYDMWEYQTAGDTLYTVLSVHGDLFLAKVDRQPTHHYPAGFSHSSHPPPEQWDSWTPSSSLPTYAKRLLGIGIIRGAYFSKLVIAYWLLSFLLLVLPGLWLWKQWRERQKNRDGHCPACSYDLRATPDHCPECGVAVGDWRT